MKITKVEGATPPLKVEEVKIREPLVEDMIQAERIAGGPQGYEYLAALISQIGEFDGKQLPPEELRRLSSKDFLSLVDASNVIDAEILLKELSTLLEKGSGEKKE